MYINVSHQFLTATCKAPQPRKGQLPPLRSLVCTDGRAAQNHVTPEIEAALLTMKRDLGATQTSY